MIDDLAALRDETLAKVEAAGDLAALDAVRVAALGKNGAVTALMKGLGAVAPESRKERGAALNALKDAIAAALDARRAVLDDAALDARLAAERLDITLPPRPSPDGLVHPISRTIEEIVAIFGAMGFTVAEGPDIEDDWLNFGALNIPAHHPARQDHDTFYMPGRTPEGREKVLRTHTSPVQIRTMEARKPPIRIIAPGRVYRCDSDQTHTPMFHQIEGLVIDETTHMGHLKWVLEEFCKAFFEVSDVKMRFRASHFPFTEPSMEVDIGAEAIGKPGAWLEILGCGMVHPNVLRNCGLDPEKYQGFAFGMGLDRLTMLKYGVPDLRAFFSADLRWLRHYGFSVLDVPTLAGGLSS